MKNSRRRSSPAKQNLRDVAEDTLGDSSSVGCPSGRRPFRSIHLARAVIGDPPGEHETLAPIFIVEAVPPDASMSFAGVDHHAGAFVNSNVGDQRSARVGREEQQVASLQPSGRIANSRLADGAPRKLDAGFLIHVLGQARAIELAGPFGAPDVPASDQACGEFDRIRCEQRSREGEEAQSYRTGNSWSHGNLLVNAAGCADSREPWAQEKRQCCGRGKRRNFRLPGYTRPMRCLPEGTPASRSGYCDRVSVYV
jgi:hypothetical protein